MPDIGVDCLPCVDIAVPLWLEVEHALLPHASGYTALQTLVRQACRSKSLRRLLKAFTTQANTDSLHQHVDRPPAGPEKSVQQLQADNAAFFKQLLKASDQAFQVTGAVHLKKSFVDFTDANLQPSYQKAQTKFPAMVPLNKMEYV